MTTLVVLAFAVPLALLIREARSASRPSAA